LFGSRKNDFGVKWRRTGAFNLLICKGQVSIRERDRIQSDLKRGTL